MEDYVTIFNNLLETYGYSKSQLSRWSGLNRTMIIRFCSGDNISTTYFFKLIRSLPVEFQNDFWSSILSSEQTDQISLTRDLSWYTLISNASYKDIQEILQALSSRWSVLIADKNHDSKENDQLEVS